MARVVVIGGGFGGLASALRLAKLGHHVTLVEERELGGALVPVTADGFTWDVVAHTLLPAVVRDLFRKTGRPLEKELDLVQLDCVREHWFADGSALVLPAGRAAQLHAFDTLGAGTRAAVARPRAARTPTTGRRCAGATSRCRGNPTPSPARWRRGSSRGRRCSSGYVGPCTIRARGWWRRTPSRPTATSFATCLPGPGSRRTSSSASACGPRPAGPAYSWRRWYAGSAPVVSTSWRIARSTSSYATVERQPSRRAAASSTPTSWSVPSTRVGSRRWRRSSRARRPRSRRCCATSASRARCATCPTSWSSTARHC